MVTNRTGQHFGRYNVAHLAKATAIMLGLSAIVYVGITPAEQASPFLSAASGLALESQGVNRGPSTGAPDSQSANGEAQAPGSSSDTKARTDGPRECQLGAGIDTACTFQ